MIHGKSDSDVVGNVLVVTARYSGARIGGDGTGQTWGRYRLVNNTFILNGTSDAIRIYTGLQTLEMHNNVFYNQTDASGTRIVNATDADWANGRQVKGSNNWVQTGSTNVPAEFTASLTGTNPGFVSLSTRDVRLASGSPLIDQGQAAPATFASYPFPSPLFPPAYQPPLHVLLTPGTAPSRPNVGTIDIGAYEYGSGGPVCTYTLSPTSTSVGAAASTGTLAIAATTGCRWTATSQASWVTVTAGGSGTGNGTINYAVAANGGTARTGTITAAGRTYTISQAAGSSPTTIDFYRNEAPPTVTFMGGVGTAVVNSGGVGGSAGIQFTGLTIWDKTKRIHYVTAKDISSIPATGKLRISIDLTPGTPATTIGVHFNDRWDVLVRTSAIDNTNGYQTFDLPLSGVRSTLGNIVNDIYFDAGDGFPAGATLKIDDIQFVP